jgi:hypothetical protein
MAEAARDLGVRLAARSYGSLAGSCARAASRGTSRAAGTRLVATARCLGRDAGGCLPLPDTAVRGLRACRAELASSCVALSCGSCQGLDQLAACLGAFTAGVTDEVASRLFTDR